MDRGNEPDNDDMTEPDLTDIVEWLTRIELRLDRIEEHLDLSDPEGSAGTVPDPLDAEER